jgi:hypothetical protein
MSGKMIMDEFYWEGFLSREMGSSKREISGRQL